MALVTGHDPICKEVCAAFGIDVKNTRSLDIRFAAGEIAGIKAVRYVEKGEAAEFVGVISRHELKVELKEQNPLKRVVRGMIDKLGVA